MVVDNAVPVIYRLLLPKVKEGSPSAVSDFRDQKRLKPDAPVRNLHGIDRCQDHHALIGLFGYASSGRVCTRAVDSGASLLPPEFKQPCLRSTREG
ncbi:hypothetical protein AAE478_003321 [Parahypoxylon ruwenzoriense]